jgi:signal transduction histidine kinase
MNKPIAEDLAAVARIDAVPTILEVVCRVTGLGFSAVARVTEDRWIACAVRDEIAFGLKPGGELKLETTICNEIRQNGTRVVIDHVAEDEVFRNHPTPALYGFQSYISIPIRRRGGAFFGTLCAIDPRPAKVNNAVTIGMFELFADLIAFHLDAHERIDNTETALSDERLRTELRDQFIAVLGHDLRNPLSAVHAAAKNLLRMPLDERATRAAAVIDRSAARMTGLIENVLDFARGRFGGGLPVTILADGTLEPMLEQVIAEMRTSQPDRVIHCSLHLNQPVVCDRARIGQLLSNLLANALTHGAPHAPVWVRARSDEEGFELSVSNQGPPIAEDTFTRLFKPFARAADAPNVHGLGLGLYISMEIARAHGGTLDVTSSAKETRFTLRLRAAEAGVAVPVEHLAVDQPAADHTFARSAGQ